MPKILQPDQWDCIRNVQEGLKLEPFQANRYPHKQLWSFFYPGEDKEITLRCLIEKVNPESVLYMGLADERIMKLLVEAEIKRIVIVDWFDYWSVADQFYADDDLPARTDASLDWIKNIGFQLEGRPAGKFDLVLCDYHEINHINFTSRTPPPKHFVLFGSLTDSVSRYPEYAWINYGDMSVGTRKALNSELENASDVDLDIPDFLRHLPD